MHTPVIIAHDIFPPPDHLLSGDGGMFEQWFAIGPITIDRHLGFFVFMVSS